MFLHYEDFSTIISDYTDDVLIKIYDVANNTIQSSTFLKEYFYISEDNCSH